MALYRFMNLTIGEHSWDWITMILYRKRKDLSIRRYPNCIGVSTRILLDLVQHGTRNIIVSVDRIPYAITDPRTWLEKGTVDRLSPNQDPHAFLNLRYFKILNHLPELREGKESEDAQLTVFLEGS